MIDMSDALERLRAANPVPAAEVALLEPDPVLFRQVTAGGARVPAGAPPRRRARRLVPVLVVASLFGGAVAYAVLRGGVSKPETVACYERADLEAATEVAVVEDAGPVAACADLWRRGVFGGTEVPPLAECALRSGVAGVFPAPAGTDVCVTLDLVPVPSTAPAPDSPGPEPSAPPPADDVNARILAFRNAALPQFLDAPCLTAQAGTDIVRRELDRAGLAGWAVVADGFSSERPCATLALEAEARRVTLVPAPPRR